MSRIGGIIFAVMMFSVLGFIYYNINQDLVYDRPLIIQFDNSYQVLLRDFSKSPVITADIDSDLQKNFADAEHMNTIYSDGNTDLNIYKHYLVIIKALSQTNNTTSTLWQYEVSETLKFLHDRTHNNL